VRSRHHAGRIGMAVADGQNAGQSGNRVCWEHWIRVLRQQSHTATACKENRLRRIRVV